MLHQMDDKPEKSKPAAMPPNARAQAEIDANLRRVYDEALNEELPDRFLHLLQQLRDKERRS